MLKTRVITGAFITAVIVAVLWFSYIPAVVYTFFGLLAVSGMYELFKAVGKSNPFILAIYSAITVLAFVFNIPYPANAAVIFSSGVIYVILFSVWMWMLKDNRPLDIKKRPEIFLIALMIILQFSSMKYLRFGANVGFRGVSDAMTTERGIYYMILPILICVLSDIGAYFCGRAFGKHKLAPVISPKKTIEGAVGGFVITLVVLIIASYFYASANGLKLNYISLTLTVMIGVVLGIIGDLSLSCIKRNVGIKDYGKLLPGHGGILDRFDSLLPVAPFVFFISVIFPIL